MFTHVRPPHCVAVIWKSVCLLESISAAVIVVKWMRRRNCQLMRHQMPGASRATVAGLPAYCSNLSATATCIIQLSAWATSVKTLTGRHATPDINLTPQPHPHTPHHATAALWVLGTFPIFATSPLKTQREGLCVKKKKSQSISNLWNTQTSPSGTGKPSHCQNHFNAPSSAVPCCLWSSVSRPPHACVPELIESPQCDWPMSCLC